MKNFYCKGGPNLSAVTFLASSKKFSNFIRRKGISNLVPADKYWVEELDGLFTMTYVYEVNRGIDVKFFLDFLESDMEVGDVIEIYHVPNQHALKDYVKNMLRKQEPIEVNISSYLYKTIYDKYRLKNKCWKNELRQKTALSHLKELFSCQEKHIFPDFFVFK